MTFRFKRWYFGEVLLLGLAVFFLTIFTWFSIYSRALKSTETSDLVQYNQGVTVDQYEYLENGRAIALSYHAKSQVNEPIVTQNAVIFVEQSTHEDNLFNKREKGDNLKVHVYQIGEKLGKPKTIDVLKLLEEKGYHNPKRVIDNIVPNDGVSGYLPILINDNQITYLELDKGYLTDEVTKEAVDLFETDFSVTEEAVIENAFGYDLWHMLRGFSYAHPIRISGTLEAKDKVNTILSSQSKHSGGVFRILDDKVTSDEVFTYLSWVKEKPIMEVVPKYSKDGQLHLVTNYQELQEWVKNDGR